MVQINEHNKKFFEHCTSHFFAPTFDDVIIKPNESKIVPSMVNISTNLTNRISLNSGILSADMDTVTEYQMARKMAMLGGMGFLWKGPIEMQEEWVDRVKFTFNAKIDKPVTINENETLDGVLKTLERYGNKFSSLVVLNNDGKVVGLVTDDRTQFGSKTDHVKDFMGNVKNVLGNI